MDHVRPPSSAQAAPASLWTIALMAVAPFPLAAFFYAYGSAAQSPTALRVLLTWSTVVLAFLGGVRWGLETVQPRPRWTRFAGSAISPVAAWGLYLGRHQLAVTWILGGFLAAFLLQWLFDHRAGGAPGRYPRLSTVLTGAACVSLGMALEQALNA